jgi:hypothetical protein
MQDTADHFSVPVLDIRLSLFAVVRDPERQLRL